MQNSLQNNYRIIGIIALSALVLILIFLVVLYSRNVEDNATVTAVFNSKNGSFEVSVPEEWERRNDPFIEATDEMEGTPDAGMKINIDAESFLYITVAIARIHYDVPLLDSMKTDEGLTVSTYIYGGRIKQVKLNDSMGVCVRVADDTYDKYEKEIIQLIKSIKIK